MLVYAGKLEDYKEMFRKLVSVGYTFERRTLSGNFEAYTDVKQFTPLLINTRDKEISKTNVTCAAAMGSAGRFPLTVKQFMDNFEALAVKNDMVVYESLIADKLEKRKREIEEQEKKKNIENEITAILSRYLVQEHSVIIQEKEKLQKMEKDIEVKIKMLGSESLSDSKLSLYLAEFSKDKWIRVYKAFSEFGLEDSANNLRERGEGIMRIRNQYFKACKERKENDFVLGLSEEEVKKLTDGASLAFVIRIFTIRKEKKPNLS